MWGLWIFKLCFFLGQLQCQCVNSKKVYSLQVFSPDSCRYIYIRIYKNNHTTYTSTYYPSWWYTDPTAESLGFQGRNLWNLWPWHWLRHLRSGAGGISWRGDGWWGPIWGTKSFSASLRGPTKRLVMKEYERWNIKILRLEGYILYIISYFWNIFLKSKHPFEVFKSGVTKEQLFKEPPWTSGESRSFQHELGTCLGELP